VSRSAVDFRFSNVYTSFLEPRQATEKTRRLLGLYNSQPNGRKHNVSLHPDNAPQAFSGGGGEIVLSLRDLLLAMRRRRWIIGVVMATVAGVVVLFNLLQTPMYESSIKILVGQERGITQNPSDVAGLQQITRTMSASVSSRPLAEAVIDQLNLSLTPEDFLEERLEVEQVPETQLIQVNYRDSSPERAQQVANTIGDIFSEQVSQVSASASAISATVWEPAVTPDRPASPHPLRNGLIALVLGLIAGSGLAILLEYLDDRWRSPEDVEQVTGVPTFGVIPEFVALTGEKKGEY
jgi:capsular polysaccharide biosynthesis protein